MSDGAADAAGGPGDPDAQGRATDETRAGETLVYALGGGLGHLARARRTVEVLGLRSRAVLLTASPHADDERMTGGLPVVRVDPELQRDPTAVRALIAARAPAELLVDAFPLGVLGELHGLQDVRVVHVARRLRWDAYARRIGVGRIRFERTLVLEPLEPPHEAFLRAHSDEVVGFSLPSVPVAPRRALPGAHWLVVHGGPDAEILELVEHARERRRTEGLDVPIALIAPTRPADLPDEVIWRDEHPAAPFLAAADRLVTAAGWNLLDEARDLGARHHVVPFPRALDDQAWRAGCVRRERGAR